MPMMRHGMTGGKTHRAEKEDLHIEGHYFSTTCLELTNSSSESEKRK